MATETNIPPLTVAVAPYKVLTITCDGGFRVLREYGIAMMQSLCGDCGDGAEGIVLGAEVGSVLGGAVPT